MGGYLDDARVPHREALHELERWKATNDQAILRDAAEKAWGAVTQASNELLDARGQMVPSGTGARRQALAGLERQDRSLRPMRLQARFSDSENVLHKECFYDGTCPLPLITEKVIEDVKEYLDDVAQLADRSRQ